MHHAGVYLLQRGWRGGGRWLAGQQNDHGRHVVARAEIEATAQQSLGNLAGDGLVDPGDRRGRGGETVDELAGRLAKQSVQTDSGTTQATSYLASLAGPFPASLARGGIFLSRC